MTITPGAYAAATPFGFAGTEREQIYDTPEGQPEFDADAGGDIYTCNVAAHPTVARPDTLVISYNVNSMSIADRYHDISNNRARFLRIGFAPADRACAAGTSG